MTELLCRNRVSDFSKWKTVFDSHAQAHRDAGLYLKNLWRGADEPDTVFFLFEVRDIKRAQAFINNPAGAEAARISGVRDGEYHFLEGSTGY